MQGVIRRRDIVAHPYVTVRCFGWIVFWRALFSGPQRTFLSLLEEPPPDDATRSAREAVERCCALEIVFETQYAALSLRFARLPALAGFLAELARQERMHQELLAICKPLACGAWHREGEFAAICAQLPGVERQVHALAARAAGIASDRDALALVLDLESSEVNRLFGAVLAATESDFVRRTAAFRGAIREHLAYVREQLGALLPEIAGEAERRLGAGRRAA